jgi:FAD-dependent urate hydroxylase
MQTDCEVVVLGAGPYGLAATAHLRSANIATRTFGKPMEFWQRQMPEDMLLRSSWEASHISDPCCHLTLDDYQRDRGVTLRRPMPIRDFIEYGLWFQQQVAPDIDHRSIATIERRSGGFGVTLSDGDRLLCGRVVIAAGIGRFANRPAALNGLPSSLVSHSSDHADLSSFVGKRVLVVGAGQSAVESAALLAECQAEVELLVRAPKVRWLRKYTSFLAKIELIRRLLYPPTDVGPPVLNRIVAVPALLKCFPKKTQAAIAYRCIRPAATSWLGPRVSKVQISTGVAIRSMEEHGNGVAVRLSDGTRRVADHVLLATGYRIDISRYEFLGQDLLAAIRCAEGYPILASGFESSVPGLHFLGAPAAVSFGPVMRFVSGTPYSARSLTQKIASATRVRSYVRRHEREQAACPVQARSGQ